MSSLKAATIAVVALLASGGGTVEAAPQVRAVVDLAEALEQRAANTNFAALEAFGQEALKRHDREGLNRLYHVMWITLNQGDFERAEVWNNERVDAINRYAAEMGGA